MRRTPERRLAETAAAILLALVVASAACAAEIHDAATAGDMATVRALVDRDPGLVKSVDARRMTPLHCAAMRGRADVAAYLIGRGAVVDEKDGMGRTSLWWCASGDTATDVASLLLGKGADVNAEDGDRWTPLMQAAFRGSERVVDLLLDAGASLPPADDPRDPRSAMLQSFAASHGLVRLMDRLLASGADVRAKDEAGNSLMHKAAAGGSPAMIGMFGRAGLPAGEANLFGWTPLHYAAEQGRRAVVESLLVRGAPIDARTTDGKTAFNLAREWGREAVAALLASRGADRGEPRFPPLSGPYLGQRLPGKTPEPFAPGLVGGRYAFHSSVVFSPDGKEACWAVQDFGGTMASLETRLVDGQWTLPRLASFGRLGRNDDVPFISPDGKRLYFVSNRALHRGGTAGKENIWVMDRTGAGGSEPTPLPAVVNALSLHWQVSVDRQGNLYFGGTDENNHLGLSDIYRARFENGTYSTPENLGSAINGPGLQHSPFIAPDGSYLLFSRMNPQAGVDGLHISFRRQDGSWTRARELNSVIHYRNRSMCPWVTPDGKYLFFNGIVAGENEPFWVDASFIDDLRKIELLPAASAVIQTTLEQEGLEAARARFKQLRAQADQFGFSERDFNALGYRLMQAGKMPEATAVFEMSVELFPDSWNVYDSMAEACLNAGDVARAEANYRLSLARNPRNANAQRVVQRMEVERRNTFEPGRPTGLKGPYLGQTIPEQTPQLFAPGIVNLLGVSDYAASFSADGKELYFTRTRGQSQTIMVCREEAAGWTAPVPASFSAGFSAHEPSVSRDNRRIYWGWFRPVPAGEPKPPAGDVGIYVAKRTASGWAKASYVGQGMFVSSSRDGEIYVTDISEAAQGNAYLARAIMANGRFARLERLQGGIARSREKAKWIAHPCIAPDGSYLVFDDGNGMMQVSFRDARGEWGDAIDLTRHGIDPNGGIASITPDGRFLFFRTGSDLYWVSTAIVEALRPGAGR